MTQKRVAAVEGWFTLDDPPSLIGSRCTSCGTVAFPKQTLSCPNPSCASTTLEDTTLSRTGTVWSYTVNRYDPPPPSVVKAPYTIAAVELADERMVVLGLAEGEPRVGATATLELGTLYTDDDTEFVSWRWRIS